MTSHALENRTRILRARAEALRECADHLELEWTEDPTERAEGMRLVREFHRRADAALDHAQDLKAKKADHS